MLIGAERPICRRWILCGGCRIFTAGGRVSDRTDDWPLRTSATCRLLELTCDHAAFNSSLPLASVARRHCFRAGDPLTSAEAHLTFARLEARVGHLDSARRHFWLCRSLLEDAPNLWLSASADCGVCLCCPCWEIWRKHLDWRHGPLPLPMLAAGRRELLLRRRTQRSCVFSLECWAMPRSIWSKLPRRATKGQVMTWPCGKPRRNSCIVWATMLGRKHRYEREMTSQRRHSPGN